MPAYKSVYRKRCDACIEDATHDVLRNGYNLGTYCEKHADEKVKVVNDYDAAVERAVSSENERE